ncbi:Alpha/Beta hydrolase protein [Xylariales sp. PMI_506]|nr:Alpha/Beta hydrolase protein [Xylariales sp. PMI_506]
MRNLVGLLYYILSASGVVCSVTADELLVNLDYGLLKGNFYQDENLTAWRKIPFAAPPVGQNRFRAPQAPLPIEGIYDTHQDVPRCPDFFTDPIEDCLYLGVWSRPWTVDRPLRPVFLHLYGGGFVIGQDISNPPYYASMNVSNENDYVAVTANYRVNTFGFLSGKEMFEDPYSDLNVGLLDQEAAMKWIQKYIHLFGGDPSQVTLWGTSAGGGSVIAHAIAHGGQTDPPLFTRGIASSPYWPKIYPYDSPEAEAVYDNMTEVLGCNQNSSRLSCLKEVDAGELVKAAAPLALGDWFGASSFTFAPVVEPFFLTHTLGDTVINKKLNGEVLLTHYNINEGTFFVPKDLSLSKISHSGFNDSEAGFKRWLRGYLPDVSDSNFDKILQLYPSKGSVEVAGEYQGAFFRAQLVYRDLNFACPAYFLATAKSIGYLFEYFIGKSEHGDDVYWWGDLNPQQVSNPVIYQGFAGAFASFVQTGDPNANKLTNSSVVPVPEISSGKQYTITDEGFSAGRLVELPQRCGFWLSISSEVPF